MFSSVFRGLKRVLAASRNRVTPLIVVVFWIAAVTFPAQAQNTSQQPPANPNQQEAPPEAGGPDNDVGPYVV
ncbi:MAG: hypothetical protein WBW85_10085, partial [Terriglobales bacterium]